MFEDIPELTKMIETINGLDSARFRPLMLKIFERLSFNVDSKIFNQDEEEKLKKVLGISCQDDLDSLLNCLESMARKVVYNVSKPKSLLSHLMSIGLIEEKAVTFAQVWANSSSDKVNQFKQESFNLSPNLLQDVNWKFRVQCNQQNASNLDELKAQLDLTLSNYDQEKKTSLEFDLYQLKNLYNELEEIQNQIDLKILQIPSS